MQGDNFVYGPLSKSQDFREILLLMNADKILSTDLGLVEQVSADDLPISPAYHRLGLGSNRAALLRSVARWFHSPNKPFPPA